MRTEQPRCPEAKRSKFCLLLLSQNNVKYNTECIEKIIKPQHTTIHADSHYFFSQRMAAYNSFIHRLLTLPLHENDFSEELNTINYIAVANGYKSSTTDRLLRKHKKYKT